MTSFADLSPELFEQILVRCDLRQLLRCKAVSNDHTAESYAVFTIFISGIKVVQRVYHQLGTSNLSHRPIHLWFRRFQTLSNL